jgi:uncharacterized protein YicC (UPF0701 family)
MMVAGKSTVGADKMKAKMNMNVDLRNVQESVEDNLKSAQTVGHKAVLAYLGMWGLAYDGAKSVWSGSISFVGRAEKRGEEIEKQMADQVGKLETQASDEAKRWRERIEKNMRLMSKDVGKSGKAAQGEFEQQVEKIMARLGIPTRDRLDKLSQEIEILSAKIDEEIQHEKGVTPAPIEGYDDLNAKDIIAKLGALSADELKVVRTYEAAHEDRVTILREVDRLLAEHTEPAAA